MTQFVFTENYDLTDGSYRNQLDLIKSLKTTKISNGYEYPLLYRFIQTTLRTIVNDVTAVNVTLLLNSDSVNFYPAKLSHVIHSLIHAKVTDEFLSLFDPATTGIDLWFKISSRFKQLDTFHLVTIMDNLFSSFESTKRDMDKRMQLFTIAEFYKPGLSFLKPYFVASVLQKQGLHQYLSGAGFLYDSAKFEATDAYEMVYQIKDLASRGMVDNTIVKPKVSDEIVQVAHDEDEVLVVRCYACGKNGHISSKCRSKNKKKKTKEAVHLVEVPDHSRVYATTNGETIVDLGQGNNEHEEEESSHFIEECFFTNEVEPKDDSFTLDCGSSIHIVKDKAKLENPRRCSVTIRGVNGRSGAAMEGEVQFGKMKLENVKFASSSPRNLLSAHLLTEKGYDILLSNADAKVFYGNVFVISFPKIGKFWEISSKNADSEMVFNVDVINDEIAKAHKANGHARLVQLKAILDGKYKDKEIKQVLNDCEDCASVAKRPAARANNYPYAIGELVQADIIVSGVGVYGLLVSDRATSYTIYRVLKSRSEASLKTIECLGAMANLLKLTGRNICKFRADNEFNTMSITNWLAGDAAAGRNAIEAEFTAAHSSFQNGGAERLNGVIQQKVKVLLNSSGVDSSYWNFAFNHAVFLHNYLPRAGGSSPFESIRGVAKPVKAEDPFGCRVFAKNFFEHNKLVNRSLSGTFIGYHKSTKVVFILEDKTNRILRTSAYKTVASVFPKKTGPAAVATTLAPAIGSAGPVAASLPLTDAGAPPVRASQLDSINGPDSDIQDMNEAPDYSMSESSISGGASDQDVEMSDRSSQSSPTEQVRSSSPSKLVSRAVEAVPSSPTSPAIPEIEEVSDSSDDATPSPKSASAIEYYKSEESDNDHKQLVPVSQQKAVIATNAAGETKVFKRKARNSDTDSDRDPINLLLSKPLKKKVGPYGQLVRNPKMALDAINKRPTPDAAHPQEPKQIDNLPDTLEIQGAPTRFLLTDGKSASDAEESFLSVARNKYSLPETYAQAVKSNQCIEWIKSMQEELTALQSNNVYDVVDLPPGAKTVSARWVYNVKDDNGSERFKSRLVCKGFSQERGENYLDYWAPVVSFDSMRVVLSIAASHKWHMVQMDASTAFLNGDIDYQVYVRPPPGTNTAAGKVWLLKKSLYGLKQAPHIWYQTLAAVLQKSGLQASAVDPCLFYGKDLLVAVYVDDMLICGRNPAAVAKVKADLSSSFKMKDLGHPKMFLGVNIDKLEEGKLKISMNDFITKVENENGIQKLAKVECPMVKGYDAYDTTSPLLTEEEQHKFRSLIGTLLYAANTARPDICFAVNLLSQFLVASRRTHLKAGYKVLHYLIQTKDRGIIYGGSGIPLEFRDFRLLDKSRNITTDDYPKPTNYTVTTLSDSDYATSKSDRKSQSGHCVFINSQLISWSSRKQSCVALSSTEAEYVALSEAGRSSVYFRNLLNEIGLGCSYINLVGDNLSALTLGAHKAIHQKTKHIDVRYHFIRALVQERIIKLNYVNTKVNLADVLTKACDSTTFKTLANLIFN